jgi:hypothetical protein
MGITMKKFTAGLLIGLASVTLGSSNSRCGSKIKKLKSPRTRTVQPDPMQPRPGADAAVKPFEYKPDPNNPF